MQDLSPNPLLSTDSYKYSHWKQYPPGTTMLESYVEIARRLAHRDHSWHDQGDWLDRALRGGPVFGEAAG